MTTTTSTFLFANRKPILIGLSTVFVVLLIGAGSAFAFGLTSPAVTHAQFDDGGSIDDGGGDVDPGFGVSPGDFGGGGGIDDSGTNDPGFGVGDPTPDTVNNTPDVSTTEDPGDVDGSVSPCNCDNVPDDVNTTPDVSNLENPGDVDTSVSPCNCDNVPPVIDTPPVITPPIVTPPVIIPPVIIPVCTGNCSPPVCTGSNCSPPQLCPSGDTGTYPNCVPPPPPPCTGNQCTPPPTCAAGDTGTYPNCVVPPPPPGGGGGGCNFNCGGGGGGGGGYGQIVQPVLPVATPASMVYLSQIPYTGLDLGPVGTVLYWVLLVLWCVAAAYLIIFMLIPFLYRRIRSFGSNVNELLNQQNTMSGQLAMAGAAGVHGPYDLTAHDMYAAPAHVASAPVVHSTTTTTTTQSNPSAYSAVEGFRSFAKGDTLTIDDIVNGLSRLPAVDSSVPVEHTTTTHTEAHIEAAPAPVILPSYQSAEEVIAAHQIPAPSQFPSTRKEAAAAAISTDVRDFCAALLAGNRDVVFSTIRQIVREGGDAETFITQVVCALDDAFRNRVDGTPVNPEIARITQGCATQFLERLTGALTNAVDSSYSPGITGSKLALTRALAVIEG